MMLRLIATEADMWNIPGPPHNTVERVAERNRALDRHCAAIGRDPNAIIRSVQTVIGYDDVPVLHTTVLRLIDAGFNHIVLALPRPYPDGVARWLADEVIAPVRSAASSPARSGGSASR
jgi:hypothetical protein